MQWYQTYTMLPKHTGYHCLLAALFSGCISQPAFISGVIFFGFFFNLPSLLPRQPALHHPLGLDGEAMETGQTHRQRRLGACGGLQRSPVDLYSASPPNSFFSLLLGRLVK